MLNIQQIYRFIRKPSLTKDMVIIALILAVGIFSTLAWLGWAVYSRQQEDRLYRYSIEADRLDASLGESFDYVTHYARFLGEKIIERGEANPDYIAELFYSRVQVDPDEQSLYSWTKFDWINPQKKMTVSTRHGVLKEVRDMSNRSYLNETPVMPWKLRFSEPAVGIPSGQWIIPTGVGVKDGKGKFYGTIGTGFNIDRLRTKLEKSSALPDSSFILFNKQFKFILQSIGVKCTDEERKALQERIMDIASMPGDAGFIPTPIRCGTMSYQFYRTVTNYPFYFLIGENITTTTEKMKEVLYPRIIEFFSIWSFGLLLLYFFRRRLVQPLLAIAKAAQNIAKGEEVVIARGHYPEINLLAGQLEEIQEVKKQLGTAKEEAEQAHDVVKQLNSHLEEKVKERTAALEKALAIKSEILNNVSHEVRSPIQGVMGLSENLAESWHNMPEEQRYACVKEISECSQRLFSFVGNLLDFSKLGEGKMHFDMRPNDLYEMVKETIKESTPLTIGKDIRLIYQKEDSASFIACCDYFTISRVLRNLFSNAIKFTESGTVSTSLFMDSLEGEKGGKHDAIHITVSDEGVGIPEHQLKEIFEPFIQSGRTKTLAGGTGLGLSIVKEIVEKHHGKIWAENNAGKGCAFHMVLPVIQHKTGDKPAPQKGEAPQKTAKPALPVTGLRILAIDDEPHCLMNISLLLGSAGHHVTTVQGGRDGLEYIIQNAAEIDVILLDMMMPDMTGLEVLAHMRTIPALNAIPVVLQTGAANESEIEEAFAMGIVACVRKPYQKAVLMEAVEKAFMDKSSYSSAV